MLAAAKEKAKATADAARAKADAAASAATGAVAAQAQRASDAASNAATSAVNTAATSAVGGGAPPVAAAAVAVGGIGGAAAASALTSFVAPGLMEIRRVPKDEPPESWLNEPTTCWCGAPVMRRGPGATLAKLALLPLTIPAYVLGVLGWAAVEGWQESSSALLMCIVCPKDSAKAAVWTDAMRSTRFGSLGVRRFARAPRDGSAALVRGSRGAQLARVPGDERQVLVLPVPRARAPGARALRRGAVPGVADGLGSKRPPERRGRRVL